MDTESNQAKHQPRCSVLGLVLETGVIAVSKTENTPLSRSLLLQGEGRQYKSKLKTNEGVRRTQTLVQVS